MTKKIIFIDIDGTILDCNRGLHKPTTKTIEAIKELKNKGHLVFIASGRAKCLVPKLIKDLNPSGYLLANGAYAELDDKVLFTESMSKEAKDKIIDFCDRYYASYYLETADLIYTKDINDPLHITFASTWDIMDCYSDRGYSDDLDINIAMLALDSDDKLIARVNDELNAYVSLNKHPNLYSFDLNIKGVSKGSGIRRLLNILNIAKDDAYAFGDGYNDIEMMMEVKHSCAMLNGVDELKEVAETITLDVLDDGFYHGVKNYGLI